MSSNSNTSSVERSFHGRAVSADRFELPVTEATVESIGGRGTFRGTLELRFAGVGDGLTVSGVLPEAELDLLPSATARLVDAPTHLVVHDGFAHDDGRPNDDFPRNRMRLAITAVDDDRTRMTIVTDFPDLASMEQVLAMGMEEGLTAAIGQIDDILAEDVAAPTGA